MLIFILIEHHHYLANKTIQSVVYNIVLIIWWLRGSNRYKLVNRFGNNFKRAILSKLITRNLPYALIYRYAQKVILNDQAY